MRLADRFSLTDKVAVVTGGGGGIGRTISAAFADAGATVIVVDISAAAVDEVVSTLRKDSRPVFGHELDITSESEVDQLFARLIVEFGAASMCS